MNQFDNVLDNAHLKIQDWMDKLGLTEIPSIRMTSLEYLFGIFLVLALLNITGFVSLSYLVIVVGSVYTLARGLPQALTGHYAEDYPFPTRFQQTLHLALRVFILLTIVHFDWHLPLVLFVSADLLNQYLYPERG